jgi:hypothetical protein
MELTVYIQVMAEQIKVSPSIDLKTKSSPVALGTTGLVLNDGGSRLRVWENESGGIEHYHVDMGLIFEDEAKEELKGLLGGPYRSTTELAIRTMKASELTVVCSDEAGLRLVKNRKRIFELGTDKVEVAQDNKLIEPTSRGGEWQGAPRFRFNQEEPPYLFERYVIRGKIARNRAGLPETIVMTAGVRFSSKGFTNLDSLMRYYLERGLTEEYHLRTIFDGFTRIEHVLG